MIDTICVRIDLCASFIPAVLERLRILTAIDGHTGEVLSRFCTGQLEGSWDSRISMSIHDKEWAYVRNPFDLSGGGRTEKIDCPPWLRVEFSLQKWLYGINCFSYSHQDAIEGLYHFQLFLREALGVDLPDVSIWRLIRLDIGHVVHFGDSQTLYQYLEHLKRIEYPRRKMRSIQYMTSVMWVGTGQTLKLYSKQDEFKKHDQPRLRRYFQNSGISDMIIERLDGILRVESSMRQRSLTSKGLYRICDLESFSESEMGDLMKRQLEIIGIRDGVARVWLASEVRALLRSCCPKGAHVTPDGVFAVWVDLCTSGRAAARKNSGDKKFYRALRVLRDLGISTVTTLSEQERESLPLPVDLKPYLDKKLLSFLSNVESHLPAHNLYQWAA